VEAAPEELQAGRTGKYSALMAATLPDFAREVLDAYDISQHKRMLDVGGGSGLFLQAAAKRSDALNLSLFDLPSVAEEARRKLSVAGLGHRSEIFTGSFKVDPLPKGADLVTFIRILLDHGDDVVEALLRSAAAAIAPGGRLLIAEAMSDRPGGSRVADAYFGFYLRAMGQGRARRPSEIFAMAERAGFRNCRLLPTRRPVLTQLIVANAPQ
ncbi:MAG: methyltransferase, partial [Pseudomonadota bacterium]